MARWSFPPDQTDKEEIIDNAKLNQVSWLKRKFKYGIKFEYFKIIMNIAFDKNYPKMKELVAELNKNNEMTTFKPNEFSYEQFEYLLLNGSVDMSKAEKISEEIDNFEIWKLLNPGLEETQAKMLFGLRRR